MRKQSVAHRLNCRSGAVAAHSVNHRSLAAYIESVVFVKMLLHTVYERTVRTDGFSALSAFQMKMIAVTADVTVQSTFSP